MTGLIEPKEMTYVPKRWGWELHIVNGEKYCGKKLFIKQDHHLSFHHHEIKDEVLFVESGEILMTYESPDGKITQSYMMPGYAFHVEPGMKHQLIAMMDSVVFEFSTQHFDSDSYRTTVDVVQPNWDDSKGKT